MTAKEEESENSGFNSDSKIEELVLSVRAFNALTNAGVKSIGDLTEKTESELITYPNLGRRAIDEIMRKLQRIGMTLGSTLETGFSSNHEVFSNIAVKSNVWIDADHPATNFTSAAYPGAIEKATRYIPGDYMLDFLHHQNPMIDPRNTQVLRDEMTDRQRAEYLAYAFFLTKTNTGWMAKEMMVGTLKIVEVERYADNNRRFSFVFSGGLLQTAKGWFRNRERTPTEVRNGNGEVLHFCENGKLSKRESYINGIRTDQAKDLP